jgi:hypothetical protein
MTAFTPRRGLCLATLLVLSALLSGAPALARTATEVCAISGDTTWAAAASPYHTTCEVKVPAGVTLTIEPGVTVQFGANHNIQVAGMLKAVGSADTPIIFEAATPGQSWGSIQLAAGSGPSEIGFAQFTGGGARRLEMLGIATNDALVHDADFGKGAGVAIEIRNASPTVRDSRFVQAVANSTQPPAALRIIGNSDPVVLGNFFQSNNTYGVYMDMNASPHFAGNRFLYNGFDGVMVSGTATRDVRWPGLGPRAWAYQVTRTQLAVEQGATLTIGAGATVKFAPGLGMQVRGTLAVHGEATRPVLFTTNQQVVKPGSWREIYFMPQSADYDEPSGLGSIIDHAIYEYGGSQPNGEIWIQDASPLISNTVLRQSGQRGLVVNGSSARPTLVADTFVDNTADPTGIGLYVYGGAAPDVSWSVFTNNLVGLRTETGAQPHVGPHNRFEGNKTYGLFNQDDAICLDASGNDWGAPNGPLDGSARADACNQGRNDGQGSLVSDHVRYSPWEGQLGRPAVTAPKCGLHSDDKPVISGFAPPGSTVTVYDNRTALGTTTAGSGQDEGPWSYTPATALAHGSHVIQAQASLGTDASGMSDPLELVIDPAQPITPAGITVSYELDGTKYVQPYQDANGCLSLSGDGDWPIRPHPGVPLHLNIPIACPGGAAATASTAYHGATYAMTTAPDGRMTATFDQQDGGTVGLSVQCGAVTTDLLLGVVTPEFDGFVYDGAKGVLSRVRQAKVTLYERDRASQQWRPWNAAAYYGQTNPQVTGLGGWFAFYPPPGLYRVLAEADGYQSAFGPQQALTIEPYVANIPLTAGVGQFKLFLPALKNGTAPGF